MRPGAALSLKLPSSFVHSFSISLCPPCPRPFLMEGHFFYRDYYYYFFWILLLLLFCFCCFSASAAFLLLLLFCFLCFCLSALCFCCFSALAAVLLSLLYFFAFPFVCFVDLFAFCVFLPITAVWCSLGSKQASKHELITFGSGVLGRSAPPNPPATTKSALHLRHPPPTTKSIF